jgi:hypothetical protein
VKFDPSVVQVSRLMGTLTAIGYTTSDPRKA